ncbi:Actinia tenebrosa protease inhibitor [Pseudolycoriella hygida]|uniref:Actinia tenebrosa protease inhibitor n=1 Tax=Pseudolycoriella hygida TaxID=35572 RepID=A0A9Q0N5G9_9DIPT|nr:Actinia tenebrosa protease inhibitor [Pseudolycoriella hygida]
MVKNVCVLSMVAVRNALQWQEEVHVWAFCLDILLMVTNVCISSMVAVVIVITIMLANGTVKKNAGTGRMIVQITHALQLCCLYKPDDEVFVASIQYRVKMKFFGILLAVSIFVVASKAEKCYPMARTGPCYGYMPRYTFNGDKCVRFIYGGCDYNDNNYLTLRDCQQNCMRRDNDSSDNSRKKCYPMARRGRCLAYMPRYTFDGEKCVHFIYGGCGYPDNNFVCCRRVNYQFKMKLLGFLLAVYIFVVVSEAEKCYPMAKIGRCLAYFPRYTYDGEKCARQYQFKMKLLGILLAVSVFVVVSEAEKCYPMARTGRCLAYFPRYTYDGAKCVRFIYGGCEYPDNNFISQRECEEACVRRGKVFNEKEYFSHQSYIQRIEEGISADLSGVSGRKIRLALSSMSQSNQKLCGCALKCYKLARTSLESDGNNNFIALSTSNSRSNSLSLPLEIWSTNATDEDSIHSISRQYQFKMKLFGFLLAVSVIVVASEETVASTGHCLAYIPRYTFTGGKCERFIYGGCGYPDNNFDSQFECETNCLNKANDQANPDFKLVTE